jgi:tetratricopeptide (TPR) repeat protein
VKLTETVGRLRFAEGWLQTEKHAGETYGPVLLRLETALWRAEMNRDPNLRRYGTLQFVLAAIHADISHYPLRARERAAIVVEYADRADVPLSQYHVALVGLAWKELANALKYVGELAAAIDAARRSQQVYADVPAFASDAAKARLVEALANRELGNLNLVLSMASECGRVFLDFGDAEAYVHARMTEALALADAKRHREALAIFSDTALDAEKRGDKHTLAICLHNAADCARALGEMATARELDARALANFEDLGTTVEMPRIRWTEAMILADEGRVNAAISELYKARAELVSLGMIVDAAAYGLDIVRLRFDRGEDVTAACVELVDTFMRLGLVQNAIEPLAYLREQSRAGRMSTRKIVRVREYVVEAGKGGARLFLPMPPDDEGGT